MASIAKLTLRLQQIRCRHEEIAAACRSLTKQAAFSKTVAPCSQSVMEIALRLFALSGKDTCAVREFLHMKRSVVEAGEVRDRYGSLPEHGRDHLLMPPADDVRGRHWLMEARRFMSERRLVQWVRYQNTTKHIAPSPGATLEIAGAACGSGTRRSQYRWLRRCMRRWGGRVGVFGIGDQLTPELFNQKVHFEPRGSSPLATVYSFPRP